jgi:hypothetical protein
MASPTLHELAVRVDRLEGLQSTAWVAQGQQPQRNPMPTTRTPSPTIPPGTIEFRVYEGADHAYYWKALRGGHTIARAGAYDRQADAVREIRRIVTACAAGKVVITKRPKVAKRR